MNKIFLMALAGLVNSGTVWAVPASSAKIAELSSHRVNRLVDLGKISADFSKKLEKIEVTAVSDGPVAFKSRVSQTQPPTGLPIQLELSFDQAGKPLAFQVIAGGVAGVDPQWPDKDPATLTENALHYVLENTANPKVKQFFDGLTGYTLVKGDLNGALVGRAQVMSSLTTEKLNIYVKLDGTFISAEITP